MIKYRQTCRTCNHTNLVSILNLGKQTIQGSFIYPNKPKPPTRAIESVITICNVKTGGCGLVQNLVTLPPEILYSNYGYRSSVSNTMKNHLKDIVNKAVNFNLLTKKDGDSVKSSVLDIGANDLFTLKQYPENFSKVGIDPSDIITQVDKEDIEIINDCFPSNRIRTSIFGNEFDIISTISCFYDIEKPVEFCGEIERLLKYKGIWVVEFAYLPSVLENLAYDGMVHEHLCLYSVSTFKQILDKVGLKIFNLEENDTNGGSIQIWVTKKDNDVFDNEKNKEEILKVKIKEFELKLDELNTYDTFKRKVIQHRQDLVQVLSKLKSEGKRVHIYGMSTKLNTILNFCGIGKDIIDCAAERSPEKWGATTISGIPIVSEEESRKTVDVYLVGPYHFKSEILAREQDMIKKGVKFLFPLPKIEII